MIGNFSFTARTEAEQVAEHPARTCRMGGLVTSHFVRVDVDVVALFK